MNKIISIITEWGWNYGNGHVQRMASLCKALNEKPGVTAALINTKKPDMLVNGESFSAAKRPDPQSALIIRDMRDSSAEDIHLLKKIAPVLVIDDIGPGRTVADHVMDLLPNPETADAGAHMRDDCYLYGHNFIESLRALSGEKTEKTIDLAFYAGAEANEKDNDFFRSLVPDGKSAVILCGRRRTAVNIPPELNSENMSYAEILLRTKVFAGHFGISLYEARLCGCAVMAINPTHYHSRLADLVLNHIVDVNAGTRLDKSAHELQLLCAKLLNEGPREEVSPAEALDFSLTKLYTCRDEVLRLS